MENWTVKSVDGVDVNAPKEEQPIAEEQQEAIKGPQAPADEVIKVDLSNPPKQEEDAVQESETEEVSLQSEAEPSQEVGEEVRDEDSPIELVVEETSEKEPVNENTETDQTGVEQQPEAATTAQEQEEVPQAQPQVNLPEGVEKLVTFMEETGGTLEDYVNLNKNLDDYNDNDLLYEYYRQSKGWDRDEINDHISDSFSYDEELDDPKDIRRMKREFKAELRDAKKYLQSNRDQYYADLKLRPRQDVDPAYQEAYDFHSSYKETQTRNEQLAQTFKERTENVFNDDFKGFDFKIGDNKYRYKVSEPSKVKAYQSDINNFVKEFIGEDGTITDAKAYHKAMFAAKNADKLAQHFYEQGRADAIKQSAAEAKNINMDPRKDKGSEVVTKSGTKVRVVDTSDGRLRFKNYRNR